jgi:hypothetical protein
VCACATECCAISALVGPFHRKCPLGCSLGRPRPKSSMATGTSPFTGFLPLPRHFIIAFNNGFHLRCFWICCVRPLDSCLFKIDLLTIQWHKKKYCHIYTFYFILLLVLSKNLYTNEIIKNR